MLVTKEFYHHYVSLPPPDQVPLEIRDNPGFYPYFKKCCGAVDGSLLDAFVSEEDMSQYRSRKGHISTNLLAACCFSLLFCYLLSSWEGSAADSRVFDNAHWVDFPIAPGTYYLGNAGFPLCDALLVPYHGALSQGMGSKSLKASYSYVLRALNHLFYLSDHQTTRSCLISVTHHFAM